MNKSKVSTGSATATSARTRVTVRTWEERRAAEGSPAVVDVICVPAREEEREAAAPDSRRQTVDFDHLPESCVDPDPASLSSDLDEQEDTGGLAEGSLLHALPSGCYQSETTVESEVEGNWRETYLAVHEADPAESGVGLSPAGMKGGAGRACRSWENLSPRDRASAALLSSSSSPVSSQQQHGPSLRPRSHTSPEVVARAAASTGNGGRYHKGIFPVQIVQMQMDQPSRASFEEQQGIHRLCFSTNEHDQRLNQQRAAQSSSHETESRSAINPPEIESGDGRYEDSRDSLAECRNPNVKLGSDRIQENFQGFCRQLLTVDGATVSQSSDDNRVSSVSPQTISFAVVGTAAMVDGAVPKKASEERKSTKPHSKTEPHSGHVPKTKHHVSSLNRQRLCDAEAMAVIEQLDLSLSEALLDSEGNKSKGSKDHPGADAQQDNLVEEIYVTNASSQPPVCQMRNGSAKVCSQDSEAVSKRLSDAQTNTDFTDVYESVKRISQPSTVVTDGQVNKVKLRDKSKLKDDKNRIYRVSWRSLCKNDTNNIPKVTVANLEKKDVANRHSTPVIDTRPPANMSSEQKMNTLNTKKGRPRYQERAVDVDGLELNRMRCNKSESSMTPAANDMKRHSLPNTTRKALQQESHTPTKGGVSTATKETKGSANLGCRHTPKIDRALKMAQTRSRVGFLQGIFGGKASKTRPGEASGSTSQDTEQKPEILNNQTTFNGASPNNTKEAALHQPSSPSVVNVDVHSGSSCALEGAVIASHSSVNGIDPRKATHHQGHFVVVAIDFGTTFSGYAFSFTRDPENIHMMRKWEGGDPGVINQKTPTCLLLTQEGEFHSFGFTARDHFHNLDAQEAKTWLYFDKFKMTLHHNTTLNRETKLSAANGKTLSALTVFAHALRYFKNHALMELSDQSATEILNEDVRWVITVPAIWRQPAKQFMRQAAYEAGIASVEYPDQLLIALEPEAASIYCRKLRMNQLIPEGPGVGRFSLIPPKIETNENSVPAIEDIEQGLRTRYIVVDCGGGTVDITVHEMADRSGSLKELYKATGGPHGSVGVDLEFEKLLNDIFGADFIEQFKSKRPAAYVELMTAFEARKRGASPYKNNPLNISLPFSFIDYYRKCKGSSVETAIKKFGHKDIRWSAQGMLRLEPDAMTLLFRPVVTHIISHVGKVVANIESTTIRYLFLVGGFAESQILQHQIREIFGSRFRVVIPQGVSLAILRGAVLYGLDPTIVCVRRSRMTYGVGVLNRFIPNVHPREKCVRRDKEEWCADVFDKFVLTDQSVGLGDTILRSYTPANSGQKQIILHIYCSENDQARFVTDAGVKRCGTLHLDLTDTQYVELPKRREIQMRMIFGDTEIKVSALDVVTQKFVRAEIDFLNL